MKKNQWVVDSEETILSSPFVKLLKRRCHAMSEGKRIEHTFYTLNSRDWTNIIPVTSKGELVLIRQHRAGIDDFTLEIPGGVVDPGEDAKSAALRELEEETGYAGTSKSFRCVDLGWTHPNPAIMNNRCHLFVAGPVERVASQKLDAGELIEVVTLPLEDLPMMIAEGKIRHALVLNSFFKLMLSQEGQELLKKSVQNFKN